MLYYGTASSAAGAGLLAGIIVFVIVPLLGLLAYWLVFLRRARVTRERIGWGAPGCAPPAGAVEPFVSAWLDRLPLLRWLPALGLFLLGATFCATTPITAILPNQTYWRARANWGAVVPYISDTGANAPAYYIFAVGLTASAGVIWAALRLVYERMDPALAALDAAHGRYGRRGEVRCVCGGGGGSGAADTQLGAPDQAPELCTIVRDAQPRDQPANEHAEAQEAAPAAARPCWCSTGRWLHCCCCCTQSMRQQGRTAYVTGVIACAGLPLLGFSGVTVQIYLHSLGAAATFGCMYLHLLLLARVQAARVQAAARHGAAALGVTHGCRRSASVKAWCVWVVPVGVLLAFLVVLPASTPNAWAVWGNYLSPLLEWAYAGVLGVYTLSLCHETGLRPPPDAEGGKPLPPCACLADAAEAPCQEAPEQEAPDPEAPQQQEA